MIWDRKSPFSILSIPQPHYLTAISNINYPTGKANKSKFGTHPKRTLGKYYCYETKKGKAKTGDGNCGSPSSAAVSLWCFVFECGRCILFLAGVHALLFCAKQEGSAFAQFWWFPGVAPALWWFLMANIVIIILLIRDLVLNNWTLSPDSLLKQIRWGRSRPWESSGAGHFHKSLAAIYLILIQSRQGMNVLRAGCWTERLTATWLGP